MKILLTITILFNLLLANQALDEIQLGRHIFTLKKESYNEYSDKGVTLMLYAKGTALNGEPTFSFILENQSGSCAAKSTQEGTYEIVDGKLKLYSHWKRSGKAYDAPIGNRIQVYSVDKNGSFILDEAKVYIEKTRRNKDADVGMKYLYTEVQTEDEKKLLLDYIGSVEHIFEAKFVMGIEASKLADEVEKALLKKKKQRWK